MSPQRRVAKRNAGARRLLAVLTLATVACSLLWLTTVIPARVAPYLTRHLHTYARATYGDSSSGAVPPSPAAASASGASPFIPQEGTEDATPTSAWAFTYLFDVPPFYQQTTLPRQQRTREDFSCSIWWRQHVVGEQCTYLHHMDCRRRQGVETW